MVKHRWRLRQHRREATFLIPPATTGGSSSITNGPAHTACRERCISPQPRLARRFQALPEGCCGPRSGCGPRVRTGRNKFPKPGPRWDGERGCCSWVPPTKGSWQDQEGQACCQPLVAILATHSLCSRSFPRTIPRLCTSLCCGLLLFPPGWLPKVPPQQSPSKE